MSLPPPQPYPTSVPPQTFEPAPRVVRAGRGLAGAIAVFLGGYLLLASLFGQLPSVAMGWTGRPAPMIPAPYATLLVLQFLFAILVVVAGLFLARWSAARFAIAAVVVVVLPIVFLVAQAGRLSGTLPLPRLGPEFAVVVQSLFFNPWFHVVLVVGVAWLVVRPAGAGWLALLGTVLLIPIPSALMFAGADSGVIALVMFALCGLVGAGIVAAGRPWRD